MNKSDILNFIQTSPTPVTKREISDAFHIKGTEFRIELKKILRELEKEQLIAKKPGGAYGSPEGLDEIMVVEVTEIDIDGDVFARPVTWDKNTPPPRIEMVPDNKGHPALKPGDRVLARLNRLSDKVYQGRTVRRMDEERGRIMGMVQLKKGGAILIPTNKKAKNDFEIAHGELKGAKDGDLAIGQIQPTRGLRKKVRIIEVLGRRDDPKAISLISLSEAGLRESFPEKVIKETR